MSQRRGFSSYDLSSAQRGGTLIMTLTFVVAFLVIFVALSGLVNQTYRESVFQAQDETAFQVAEAGLDYGRWRLAHAPANFTAETRTMTDQFAGDLGDFSLTFTAPTTGSTIVEIESVGTTVQQTTREVTLRARYGQPSLAQFSSIVNSDVWYGGVINGPVHANGGIRMDGSSESLVTSAQETYPCQTFHGCSAPFEIKDGVWGSGTIQSLWEFPVAPVDYNSITLDLLDMSTVAQAAGTYYGPSGDFGYEIVFNDDDTYSISRVTARGPSVWSWWDGEWSFTSHDVGSTVLVESQTVPANGVIYVEDTVWVRGDIRNRVTVAAGVFPDNPATRVDVIINGNIDYDGVTDGSRAFGVVAQNNVLIPWSGAPDQMILDGAYVAQQGAFHRRYYPDCCGSEAHRLKTSLTRYGMIASNGVPATTWVDGGGAVISGYQTGSATYDSNLLFGPPPYFPTTGQYQFISWEEQQ